MDHPDIVLVGIPIVVVSGYTMATISTAFGVAGAFARLFQAIGYVAAAALICWAVWIGIDRDGG